MRLLPEAFEVGHGPRFARGFQLGDGVDFQFVVERLHLLRPDARQAQHVHETRRNRSAQLVQVVQPPGRGQGDDLELQGLADAADIVEVLGRNAGFEVPVEPGERPRPGRIRPHAEVVLPLELQEGAYFFQRGNDFVFGHGWTRFASGSGV